MFVVESSLRWGAAGHSMVAGAVIFCVRALRVVNASVPYPMSLREFWIQTVPVTSGTYRDPAQHGPSFPAAPPFWSKSVTG